MEKEQKMTVMDVVLGNPDASIVMFKRHYSYLMGPIMNQCPDENSAYAGNYSEKKPSVLFLCDKAGCEMGWKHGRMLAHAGIEPVEIIGSHQGRGPHTGLLISEGYQEATGKWLSVRCHQAVDYPVYNFEPVKRCLDEIGDPFVAQWLNGDHKDLVKTDTPHSFKGRVTGFITDMLEEPGFRIITTHFELVTLVHALYVEGKDLGEVPEDWAPQKGGGVLIVKNGDDIQAYDYDNNLNIV